MARPTSRGISADVQGDGEPAGRKLPGQAGGVEGRGVLDRQVDPCVAGVLGEQLVVVEAARGPGLLKPGRNGGGPEPGEGVVEPGHDVRPGQVRSDGDRGLAFEEPLFDGGGRRAAFEQPAQCVDRGLGLAQLLAHPVEVTGQDGVPGG